MLKKRKRQCSWTHVMKQAASEGYPTCECMDVCIARATVKRNRRYYCRAHDPVRLLLREMKRLKVMSHSHATGILLIGGGRL